MDRRLFIVIAVIGFHALGLWALQTGLLRRAVELVVPVEVLAELIEPPQPQVAPAPPPPQPPQPIQKQVAPPKPVPKLAPQPMAIADPAPSASAPTGTAEPQPAAPPIQSPASRNEAPAAAAIPKETIPSTNIDHRFRPQPPYPTLSTRLGEEGVVILKVMVSKDGRPLTVQVTQSSGYHRLDNVAEQTVKNRWSFTPGTSNGVPVDMEATITLRFSLDP